MVSPLTKPFRLFLPAPALPVVAWLLAPSVAVDPAVEAELRQTLTRRLVAVLLSGGISALFPVVAFLHHPSRWIVAWLAVETTLAALRLPLIVYLIRAANRQDEPAIRPWIVDLFVLLGTAWSLLLGLGSMLCLITGDPGLSVLAALQTMGTIGAQGVRSPGTPRLNILQMCLIVVPLVLGAILTPISTAFWVAVITPPYLFAMISITRLLSAEYISLIVARMENARRALHCSLTGLANRSLFNTEMAAALDAGADCTVLCLDLDGFKRVNDGFGHPAGDSVLRQTAERLRTVKRAGVVPGRLGGDEFAILLPGCPRDDAEAIATALIDTLARPYDLGTAGLVRVGASLGLAVAKAGFDPQIAMKGADEALYVAKRHGKGTFRWHEAPATPSAAGAPGAPGAAGLRALADEMRARLAACTGAANVTPPEPGSAQAGAAPADRLRLYGDQRT